jgi:hypothetical protein
MVARVPLTRAIAFAVAAGTVGVMFWRMRHGVDFSDEAFYAALPLRFALGDRPFIDELNITQTAGLLIYPFVKVYTAIVGSAAGLMLSLRILYLAFFACVGWSAYALARTRLSPSTSLLVGAACLCVIPYCIPGLSYNTLTMGFFALGLFVAARGLIAAPASSSSFLRSPLVLAGFAHGAATFAYPTMALGAATTTLSIAILAKGARARAVLRYVTGGIAFAVLVSPSLLRAGPSRLREVVAYTGGEQATSGLGERLHTVGLSFLSFHPQLLPAGLLIAVAVLYARRWPMPAAAVLPLAPLLALGSEMDSPILASIDYVACLGVLAPLLCLAIRDTKVARVLLVGVAMPAFVAGAATAWSSSNAAKAAGIGLYPAAILAALAIAISIEQAKPWFRRPFVRAALELSPVVLVATLLAFAVAPHGYYREKSRSELTALVSKGPYAGIYTAPATKTALERVSAEVHARVRGERVLFFYDFPAGYLIAFRRPMVTSPWTFVMPTRIEPDARFFRERAEAGELVVRDDGRWAAISPPPPPETLPDGAPLGGTPLDLAVSERCDLVGKIPGFSMYVVRSAEVAR